MEGQAGEVHRMMLRSGYVLKSRQIVAYDEQVGEFLWNYIYTKADSNSWGSR